MRRSLTVGLLLLVSLFAFARPAHAWSFKEHILLTRLAVQRLLADPETPPEMKAWLREAAPTAGDLELLVAGDGIKQYKHNLSNKPKLQDMPRDWRDPRLVQAGYLPWRIEQIYGELVNAFREKRLMPKDQNDRDNALVFAGYLAHYLADNTQPHHATIDFRSRAYFAIPQRAPDVHGMLEYGMVDWEGRPYPELRQELWERLCFVLARIDKKVAGRTDPWETTVQMSLYSYDALPLIGAAAQAAVGQNVKDGDPAQPVDAPAREADQFDMEAFFHQRAMVQGCEMSLLDVKARQLSLAVLRIEAMLRQAWEEGRDQ